MSVPNGASPRAAILIRPPSGMARRPHRNAGAADAAAVAEQERACRDRAEQLGAVVTTVLHDETIDRWSEAIPPGLDAAGEMAERGEIDILILRDYTRRDDSRGWLLAGSADRFTRAGVQIEYVRDSYTEHERQEVMGQVYDMIWSRVLGPRYRLIVRHMTVAEAQALTAVGMSGKNDPDRDRNIETLQRAVERIIAEHGPKGAEGER